MGELQRAYRAGRLDRINDGIFYTERYYREHWTWRIAWLLGWHLGGFARG